MLPEIIYFLVIVLDVPNFWDSSGGLSHDSFNDPPNMLVLFGKLVLNVLIYTNHFIACLSMFVSILSQFESVISIITLFFHQIIICIFQYLVQIGYSHIILA